MSTINIPNEKPTHGRWLIIFLLFLTTAVALVAWFVRPTTNDVPTTEANQPQTVWQQQDIDNYRYTLTLSCFCLMEMVQPVTIEVINGELASVTYAENGEPAEAMFFEHYSSIDKLHAIIAEAEAQNPARLDVTYDPTTGVPLDVDIDISETMADEEIRFTVTNFEPLP